MRNIRDYKVRVREDRATLGSASPFHIVKTALTLAGFTREEVATLYGQHTADTGQVFPSEFVDAVYARTLGQPWLVNAIGAEVVDVLCERDVARPIRPAMAGEAAERLGAPEAWLVLFDRSDRPWDEKIRWETLERAGRSLHVVGC